MEENSQQLASNEWHFLTRYPPSYLNRPFDIVLFRRWILETDEAFPGFQARLRTAAIHAVASVNTEIIRQGLQCLATVGTAEDSKLLQAINSADPLVERDVRTCLFEIKMRARGS